MSRRRLVAGSAVIALAFASACTRGNGDADDADAFRQKAAALTDLVAKNDWKAVRRDFDATMLAGLSEASMESAWEQGTQQVGSYQSRGEPKLVPKPGEFTVFDTPMQFERGGLKSRFAFRPDGKVAGYFVLLPNVP